MSTLKEKAEEILQEKEEKIIPENFSSSLNILGVQGALTSIYDIQSGPTSIEYKEEEVPGEDEPVRSLDYTFIYDGKGIVDNTTFLLSASAQNVANAIGLTADMIKKDEIVLGVTGTYEGSGSSIPEEAKITDANKLFDRSPNFTKFNYWADIGLFGEIDSASSMFYNCSSLIYGTTSFQFDFDKVNFLYCSNMDNMFAANFSIVDIDVTGLQTRGCNLYDNMFYDCNNLENIDISNFNMINAYGVNNMFKNCTKLSNNSLNSILLAFQTCRAEMFETMGNSMTLAAAGLTEEQALICTTLSNWANLKAQGWTTGY